ncbi:MAG: CvpA family protein [Planctomycetia bacterium]|nr:CvpA family protein [Planctomycetia bacterium]
MIFNVILLLVFLGVLGSTMRDGLWNNTIRILNFVFAATLATSLGEPVAKLLCSLFGAAYFYYNYLALWLVFALAYMLLHELTRRLSQVEVKFHSQANLYGGYAASALLSFLFLSFALFAMHQAPLGEHFLFGGFDQNSRMFFGTAPDRQWHDYMSWVSRGAYSAGQGTAFDPNNDYGKRYGRFRADLQEYNETKGTTGFDAKQSGGGKYKRP